MENIDTQMDYLIDEQMDYLIDEIDKIDLIVDKEVKNANSDAHNIYNIYDNKILHLLQQIIYLNNIDKLIKKSSDSIFLYYPQTFELYFTNIPNQHKEFVIDIYLPRIIEHKCYKQYLIIKQYLTEQKLYQKNKNIRIRPYFIDNDVLRILAELKIFGICDIELDKKINGIPIIEYCYDDTNEENFFGHYRGAWHLLEYATNDVKLKFANFLVKRKSCIYDAFVDWMLWKNNIKTHKWCMCKNIIYNNSTFDKVPQLQATQILEYINNPLLIMQYIKID